MTHLQRDLIVFDKTDDLHPLFLFGNGTAKLNEKKIQYFELCCNKHIQIEYIHCFTLTCYYIIMNISFNVSPFTSFIRGFGLSPPLSGD